MSNTNTQVAQQYRFNMILSPEHKAALERVVGRLESKLPGITITQSDVVRRLIVEEDRKYCPICDGPTSPDPDRPGCLYCPQCQEPVFFNGEAA